MKSPTWFNRWQAYGWSVAGHIAQGAAGGLFLGLGHPVPCILMAAFFIVYQLGSGARKYINEGHVDTMGLDSFDWLVGFVPAYLLCVALPRLV